tara:strand:+ start:103 stop:348 length:246 start_codon:yes stop_codon:yes gene_type:complete
MAKNNKPNQGTTLADLINPEVRNILEKYKRLGVLVESIGIPASSNQDLLFIQKELDKYKDHKLYAETLNLTNKLLTITKKS